MNLFLDTRVYPLPAPRSCFLPFGFDASSYSVPDDLALKLRIGAIETAAAWIGSPETWMTCAGLCKP
jgi:hypothetical protein